MDKELICAAHLRRTGKKVRASRLVNGEGMCRACFGGKPIQVFESKETIPWFLVEGASEVEAQTQGTRRPRGKGEIA